MKYSIIFLICIVLQFQDFSQAVQKSSKAIISFSRDSALFNDYMQAADRYSGINKDSSKSYLHKAHQLALATGYEKGMAEYFHFLAADLNGQNQYDSAMKVIDDEIFHAQRSKDIPTIAWAYNALANTYEYMGQMDSATTYFIKALKIAEPVAEKNRKLTGTLNYNLASVLYLIGDYKRALSYAEKGYQLGLLRNDTHMMSNSLLDIGSIQVGLKNYDSALTIFNRVINLVKNTSDSSTTMDALNDEADVYATMKQYDRALKKYDQMLLMAQRDHNRYELMYAYGNLGITQLQLQNTADAEKNLKKAIQIGLELNAKNELRQFYKSLSEVEETRNNFRLSLHYLKKYDSLNNELMNEATRKNMHLLEVKFRTSQKDKEIAEQNLVLAKRKRDIERRNTLLILFLGGILALVVILVLSIRNYKHKKRLHKQAFMNLKKQHEIENLTAKMTAREEERNRIGKEMHDDVGSALTTILYLADDLKSSSAKNSETTAQKIANTAGLVMDKMNEIIWSMNPEYDTVDDLVAYTRQHAAQFLENHNISFHFDVPDSIPEIYLKGEQRRNIYLVIKEALHNIIKHADAKTVWMKFEIGKNISVSIHDDGKGINLERLKRFGNGLQNMKQRMEAVEGSFEIRDDHGTTIKLESPL